MPIHKNIFSDKEAWGIYRLSAFGEAFGWTLLIGSLGAQKYLMHGNKILVSFAGQIHGLLFFAYIAIQDAAFPNSWICPPDSFWNVLSPSKTTEALMLARKK